MALEVNHIKKREFKFKKGGEWVTLPDPDPKMTTDEVLQYHSKTYPELTTATLEEPKVTGDTATFNVKTTVGTKG